MRKSIAIIQNILKPYSQQDIVTFRDGGTGWTALEVMCHLRDYEAVSLERAQISIGQENATMPSFSADEAAAAGRYNEQNLTNVYAEWSKRRGNSLTYLEGLSEADWERTAIHPKRGLMSVQDQLALTAWHDVNHIEQMTRILAEKKA
jgi:hypothetical protein